jgi:hypothetical protein
MILCGLGGRFLQALWNSVYSLPKNPVDGPRWSLQNRPYVVTSKPAIEIGLRRDCFTARQRAFARLGLICRSWV